MIKKIIYKISPPILWKVLCWIKVKVFSFAIMEKLLINYKIGKFTIYIPILDQLPRYQKKYPNYLTNPGRIAMHIKEKYPNLTCINIGANVGDTVAILRNKAYFPILAVEPNDYFYEILKKNIKQFSDVYIKKAFLSDSNKTIDGHMIREYGSATFVRTKEKGHTEIAKTLIDILNEYLSFNNSKLVIIDTDGFDCKIIRGARDWLSEIKPVIFFEYDPCELSKQLDDGFSIFRTLSFLGYENLMIYSNIGEYICSVNIKNETLLKDIHEYFSGRNSYSYCDICVFSGEDLDLFNKIRLSEIEYFRCTREV